MPLHHCPKCKENSVAVKIYQTVKRIEFCINRGCGYSQPLPNLTMEKSNEVNGRSDMYTDYFSNTH